jgi:hypothetical protein
LDFELNGFKTGSPNSYINTNTDEQRILKVFEKTYPLVEELDKLLSHRPYLGRIIIVADISLIL